MFELWHRQYLDPADMAEIAAVQEVAVPDVARGQSPALVRQD
jgi:hypothetical protein